MYALAIVVLLLVLLVLFWRNKKVESITPGKNFISSVFGSKWIVNTVPWGSVLLTFGAADSKTKTFTLTQEALHGRAGGPWSLLGKNWSMKWKQIGPTSIVLTSLTNRSDYDRLIVTSENNQLVASMDVNGKVYGPYKMTATDRYG